MRKSAWNSVDSRGGTVTEYAIIFVVEAEDIEDVVSVREAMIPYEEWLCKKMRCEPLMCSVVENRDEFHT